ncbi:hypothetical protein UR09_06135 [Candidatus Nitromaritima sp. SCGC AAA799-A02]|nr:hypothetical protein UR09_06135 [Candidatus Nitromaritima sp. SCGC AAA799-A02]KMP11227.1 hypothetical protein UZ36_05210 [Candidatus Nitromaritima sp. SCGC AAA799-C22]
MRIMLFREVRPLSTIESVMHTTILDVPDSAMVQDVIDAINANKIGALLVKKDDEYIGIITREDIIQKVTGKLDPKSTKAAEVMSSPINKVDVNTSIGDACIIACEKRRRHLVIAKDGNIVGILAVKDLVPEEIMNISLTTDELFNRVGLYGDELLAREKASG